MTDLFAPQRVGEHFALGPRAMLLCGYALDYVEKLLPALIDVAAQAPFRHMVTPGGRCMSVATTSCGEFGWISDPQGYRYTGIDPHSGQRWPALPDVLERLARNAAEIAGFTSFQPDSCLINRYRPGARMSLHQDRNERDFAAPIVSVSLGMSATFLFGGHARSDKAHKVPLLHGDVVVWGGEDRLRFHGVLPVIDNPHAQLGSQRINLTLRKAA